MRKTFFSARIETPQPPLSSALSWATTVCQSLPVRDVRFCLPENRVFQPQLNSEAACPAGRSLPPCTAGSSTTRTAGATVRALLQACPQTHICTFCSFRAPSVSLCLGFFPRHPAPHPCSQQSAADIFDRRSLYVTFVRAIFSHTDE